MEVEQEKLRRLAEVAQVTEEHKADGARRFSLRHAEAPDVELAGLTVAPSNVMYELVVHDALPFNTAKNLLTSVLANGSKPMALAPLHGLCASVALIDETKLAAEFGDEAAEAVKAVSIGRPRPGHSVLGQGTFRAAASAWQVLAQRYALSEDEEVKLYRNAGLSDLRIQAFGDMSAQALTRSGGAVAWLAFPGGFAQDSS